MVNARSRRGSMLALIVATSIMLGGALLFACWYMASGTLFTSHASAIDAAALQAAHDIGRIVVDTPEFGYVSLCDEAPIGTNTKAEDNYFTHVKSINELMATTRLCSIIADEINDPFVKQLAERDRQSVIQAKNALLTAISGALGAGQFAYDIEGTKVFPYDNALQAYMKNAAPKSKYVAGSMKLEMGSMQDGMATAVPIASPASFSNTTGAQQVNGFYKSDTSIPYDGKDFVFAAVGTQPQLIDQKKFTTSVPGLPYQMPGLVRVTAKQEFGDGDRHWTVNYVACANSGRAIRSPTPGALAFSFPDGPVVDLKKPADLRTWGEMSKTSDLLTSWGGDFPVDKPGAMITDSPRPWSSPWNGLTAPCREVASCALYDWLRAGGAIVKVDKVVSMMSTNWDAPPVVRVPWKTHAPATGGVVNLVTIGQIPAGIQHKYSFDSTGNVIYTSSKIKPQPYIVAGEKQLYAENPGGDGSQCLKSNNKEWRLESNLQLPSSVSDLNPVNWVFLPLDSVKIVGTKYFDMYVRDMLRQPGAQNGGKHRGTPMDGKRFVARKGAADFGSGGFGAGSDGDGGGDGGGGDGDGGGGPAGGPPNPGGSGSRNNARGYGLPPMVTAQDDFATTSQLPREYLGYSTGPNSGAPRPTYTTTGTVADVRFRREIDLGGMDLNVPGTSINATSTGYIGEMLD